MIPLPPALSGVVVERVIQADSALLYIVTGAITALLDCQRYQQTGTLTEDAALSAISEMIDAYFDGAPVPPNGGLMLGTIVPYATTAVPERCLACDGATYLKADYPDLAATLDSAFEVDATHFKTPDLRGRTVIGAGTGSGLTARAVGAIGGAENIALTIAQMPSHTHSQSPHSHSVNDTGHSHGVSDPGHIHTVPGRQAASDGTGVPRLASNTTSTNTNNTSSATTGLTVNAAVTGISVNAQTASNGYEGGGGAHNNMQPFIALKYAIVALP